MDWEETRLRRNTPTQPVPVTVNVTDRCQSHFSLAENNLLWFIKNISFVVINFKSFQHLSVFIQKCFFLMMCFLVLDVADNIVDMRF
jgi:hypothetical protein